jgi:hypothetical protein
MKTHGVVIIINVRVRREELRQLNVHEPSPVLHGHEAGVLVNRLAWAELVRVLLRLLLLVLLTVRTGSGAQERNLGRYRPVTGVGAHDSAVDWDGPRESGHASSNLRTKHRNKSMNHKNFQV